jgi:UDP-N-acetyl-2-amino-2-deoxyglucuronate dehydrogenase
MHKDSPFGFGLIGCGMISNSHAQAILADKSACLVGVTDPVVDARSAFAAKYGVRVFGSVEEMLACPEVHAVCICTPSGLHAPLAIKAASAGKHVVVEKPMAISLKEADDLIAISARNGVKVEVISQLRFTPAVRALKAAVDGGLLGRMLSGDITMKYLRTQEYYDKGGWRGTWAMDGGGALMNQGIHGIDLLQYIMGPVKGIFGYARTLSRRIEVEDTASGVVEFQSGALGIIQATTSVVPGYPRRLSVHGEKGSIILEEDSVLSWDVGDTRPPDGVPIGPSRGTSFHDPTAVGMEGHKRQIADLIEAVRTGRRPFIDAEEGRKPVQIILALYESSRTRREVLLGG